jgi:hypothetical protein
MSIRLSFLVLLLAGGAPIVGAADAPPSETATGEMISPGAVSSEAVSSEVMSADAGSFERTHERIKAIFRGRDSIPAVPSNVRNPFSRLDERRPASPNPADSDSSKQPALTDSALLERIAAAVQIRGIVEASGRPSLIINRKRFDEGDRLTVLYGGAPVEIVIKRITSETFTLGYKEAEITLRLPR